MIWASCGQLFPNQKRYNFRVDGQNEAAGAADARFWPYTEAMGWIRSFYRLCLIKYQLFDYQNAAIENPALSRKLEYGLFGMDFEYVEVGLHFSS